MKMVTYCFGKNIQNVLFSYLIFSIPRWFQFSVRIHGIGKKFREWVKHGLGWYVKRFTLCMLYFKRVMPQFCTTWKISTIRVNCAAITNIINRVRMSWPEDTFSDYERLHTNLFRIVLNIFKTFKVNNFTDQSVRWNWGCWMFWYRRCTR